MKFFREFNLKNRYCLSPNSEPSVEVPSCAQNLQDDSIDNGGGVESGAASASVDCTSAKDRLAISCRDYSQQYRDVQEKYFEVIYATLEKVMQSSQASQMKQLRASLDKVTSEVMSQLGEARKAEVKNLLSKYPNKDEFIRYVKTIKIVHT